MSALIILPSIWPDYTRDCLNSMHPSLEERTLVVDNIELNRGVAGSWNIGIDAMLSRGDDWLILCSAAVRFGEMGGCELLVTLEDAAYQAAYAVEAGRDLGWHLIAFPRHVIETVGYFDPNIYPAYSDDLDYSYRMQLAFNLRPHGDREPLWPKIDVDARLESVAHGIQIAHVHVDFVGLEQYLTRKWGGHKDTWDSKGWEHPFNDPRNDWRWYPVPPDPRCFLPEDRPAELEWPRP